MAKEKKGRIRKAFKGFRFFLISFLLVCVMCASICGVALALYLRVYIEPNAKIDINDLMFEYDKHCLRMGWRASGLHRI